MVDISRVRTAWTGFVGAPGVTTMYFYDTATAVDSVHTFFNNIQTYLPSDVHLQVENVGDVIDDATGNLVDTWTSDSVGEVTGSDGGSYAAPAGAVVDWLTNTIGAHRRLRGRSFIVPLADACYQSDGTLDTTHRAGIQSAASGLVEAQSASFCVWHRGVGGAGSSGLVTSAFVPDLVAILRSRRD